MNQSRREFTGHLVKGAVVVSVVSAEGFMLSGCNVFTDVLNWVPTGEAALNSILSILGANGIIIVPGLQTIVGLIEAGFTALTAAIKEYKSTTPPPVGALQKIETGFKDIVDNFKTFLQSLSVSSPLLSIIVGIAQIIFSTIAAFMNRLPAASSLKRTVVLGSTLQVGGTTVAFTPKDRSVRRFKKDVNSFLDDQRHSTVTIPKNAYLPLSLWEKL